MGFECILGLIGSFIVPWLKHLMWTRNFVFCITKIFLCFLYFHVFMDNVPINFLNFILICYVLFCAFSLTPTRRDTTCNKTKLNIQFFKYLHLIIKWCYWSINIPWFQCYFICISRFFLKYQCNPIRNHQLQQLWIYAFLEEFLNHIEQILPPQY